MSSRNPASLVASFASIPRSEALAALPHAVDWLEVRADLTTPVDATRLRQDFHGQLLFALPSRTPAGSPSQPQRERQRLLTEAAQHFDLVELEAEHDLDDQLLAQVPPAKRLISWHGSATTVAALKTRFAALADVPARCYKLVTEAQASGGELAPLSLLREINRKDVIAFASGETGFWTRLIAPRLGCPMLFATCDSQDEEDNTRRDPAQPTLEQLVSDYGLPALPPVHSTYGMVGRNVLKSLFPRLHNAVYRSLGLPAIYLPFRSESFSTFWSHLVADDLLGDLGMPLQGLTVVAPHKEAAYQATGGCTSACHRTETETPCSDFVHRAGAANLLTRRDHTWMAGSTDPQGVLDPLQQRQINVRGRTTAVIGCGGAGRAIAAGLDAAGARVALVNRSPDRGNRAAEQLGLPFIALEDFDPRGFALVIHATPVVDDQDEPLFDVDRLETDAVVVELVYGPRPTALVTSARDRNLTVVDGREVLLAQARRQIHNMTGQEVSLQQLRAFIDSPPTPF